MTIPDKLKERCYREVDGYLVYGQADAGFLEAHHLREIADYLDQENAEWDAQVKALHVQENPQVEAQSGECLVDFCKRAAQLATVAGKPLEGVFNNIIFPVRPGSHFSDLALIQTLMREKVISGLKSFAQGKS